MRTRTLAVITPVSHADISNEWLLIALRLSAVMKVSCGWDVEMMIYLHVSSLTNAEENADI